MKVITSRPKHFRTATSLKSVSIEVKEWFDRTYGNSYFSAQVTINNKYIVLIPFSYGYGDHALTVVTKALQELKLTTLDLYRWQDQQLIDFNHYKQENCLKRDVVVFGKEY